MLVPALAVLAVAQQICDRRTHYGPCMVVDGGQQVYGVVAVNGSKTFTNTTQISTHTDALFALQLTVAPSGNVTIMPSVSKDLVVTPASLTYTPGNWDSSQTLTVSARASVDFFDVRSSTMKLEFESEDGRFCVGQALPIMHTSAVGPIYVAPPFRTKLEDKGPTNWDGKSMLPRGVTEFRVVLAKQPSTSVSLTFHSTDPELITEESCNTSCVAKSFTTTNWSVPQIVRVMTKPNNAITGDKDIGVFLVASSTDPDFQGALSEPVFIEYVDTDKAGVEARPVTGAKSDTYILSKSSQALSMEYRLKTQPNDTISINLCAVNETLPGCQGRGIARIAADTDSLSFTSQNWNQWQSVNMSYTYNDSIIDSVCEDPQAGQYCSYTNFEIALAGIENEGRAWQRLPGWMLPSFGVLQVDGDRLEYENEGLFTVEIVGDGFSKKTDVRKWWPSRQDSNLSNVDLVALGFVEMKVSPKALHRDEELVIKLSSDSAVFMVEEDDVYEPYDTVDLVWDTADVYAPAPKSIWVVAPPMSPTINKICAQVMSDFAVNLPQFYNCDENVTSIEGMVNISITPSTAVITEKFGSASTDDPQELDLTVTLSSFMPNPLRIDVDVLGREDGFFGGSNNYTYFATNGRDGTSSKVVGPFYVDNTVDEVNGTNASSYTVEIRVIAREEGFVIFNSTVAIEVRSDLCDALNLGSWQAIDAASAPMLTYPVGEGNFTNLTEIFTCEWCNGSKSFDITIAAKGSRWWLGATDTVSAQDNSTQLPSNATSYSWRASSNTYNLFYEDDVIRDEKLLYHIVISYKNASADPRGGATCAVLNAKQTHDKSGRIGNITEFSYAPVAGDPYVIEGENVTVNLTFDANFTIESDTEYERNLTFTIDGVDYERRISLVDQDTLYNVTIPLDPAREGNRTVTAVVYNRTQGQVMSSNPDLEVIDANVNVTFTGKNGMLTAKSSSSQSLSFNVNGMASGQTCNISASVPAKFAIYVDSSASTATVDETQLNGVVTFAGFGNSRFGVSNAIDMDLMWTIVCNNGSQLSNGIWDGGKVPGDFPKHLTLSPSTPNQGIIKTMLIGNSSVTEGDTVSFNVTLVGDSPSVPNSTMTIEFAVCIKRTPRSDICFSMEDLGLVGLSANVTSPIVVSADDDAGGMGNWSDSFFISLTYIDDGYYRQSRDFYLLPLEIKHSDEDALRDGEPWILTRDSINVSLHVDSSEFRTFDSESPPTLVVDTMDGLNVSECTTDVPDTFSVKLSSKPFGQVRVMYRAVAAAADGLLPVSFGGNDCSDFEVPVVRTGEQPHIAEARAIIMNGCQNSQACGSLLVNDRKDGYSECQVRIFVMKGCVDITNVPKGTPRSYCAKGMAFERGEIEMYGAFRIQQDIPDARFEIEYRCYRDSEIDDWLDTTCNTGYLTFTPQNYNMTQNVSVYARDNTMADNQPSMFTVVLESDSSDRDPRDPMVKKVISGVVEPDGDQVGFLVEMTPDGVDYPLDTRNRPVTLRTTLLGTRGPAYAPVVAMHKYDAKALRPLVERKDIVAPGEIKQRVFAGGSTVQFRTRGEGTSSQVVVDTDVEFSPTESLRLTHTIYVERPKVVYEAVVAPNKWVEGQEVRVVLNIGIATEGIITPAPYFNMLLINSEMRKKNLDLVAFEYDPQLGDDCDPYMQAGRIVSEVLKWSAMPGTANVEEFLVSSVVGSIVMPATRKAVVCFRHDMPDEAFYVRGDMTGKWQNVKGTNQTAVLIADPSPVFYYAPDATVGQYAILQMLHTAAVGEEQFQLQRTSCLTGNQPCLTGDFVKLVKRGMPCTDEPSRGQEYAGYTPMATRFAKSLPQNTYPGGLGAWGTQHANPLVQTWNTEGAYDSAINSKPAGVPAHYRPDQHAYVYVRMPREAGPHDVCYSGKMLRAAIESDYATTMPPGLDDMAVSQWQKLRVCNDRDKNCTNSRSFSVPVRPEPVGWTMIDMSPYTYADIVFTDTQSKLNNRPYLGSTDYSDNAGSLPVPTSEGNFWAPQGGDMWKIVPREKFGEKGGSSFRDFYPSPGCWDDGYHMNSPGPDVDGAPTFPVGGFQGAEFPLGSTDLQGDPTMPVMRESDNGGGLNASFSTFFVPAARTEWFVCYRRTCNAPGSQCRRHSGMRTLPFHWENRGHVPRRWLYLGTIYPFANLDLATDALQGREKFEKVQALLKLPATQLVPGDYLNEISHKKEPIGIAFSAESVPAGSWAPLTISLTEQYEYRLLDAFPFNYRRNYSGWDRVAYTRGSAVRLVPVGKSCTYNEFKKDVFEGRAAESNNGGMPECPNFGAVTDYMACLGSAADRADMVEVTYYLEWPKQETEVCFRMRGVGWRKVRGRSNSDAVYTQPFKLEFNRPYEYDQMFVDYSPLDLNTGLGDDWGMPDGAGEYTSDASFTSELLDNYDANVWSGSDFKLYYGSSYDVKSDTFTESDFTYSTGTTYSSDFRFDNGYDSYTDTYNSTGVSSSAFNYSSAGYSFRSYDTYSSYSDYNTFGSNYGNYFSRSFYSGNFFSSQNQGSQTYSSGGMYSNNAGITDPTMTRFYEEGMVEMFQRGGVMFEKLEYDGIPITMDMLNYPTLLFGVPGKIIEDLPQWQDLQYALADIAAGDEFAGFGIRPEVEAGVALMYNYAGAPPPTIKHPTFDKLGLKLILSDTRGVFGRGKANNFGSAWLGLGYTNWWGWRKFTKNPVESVMQINGTSTSDNTVLTYTRLDSEGLLVDSDYEIFNAMFFYRKGAEPTTTTNRDATELQNSYTSSPGGSGYTYSPPDTSSPGGSGYTYSPPGGSGYTYSPPGGSGYTYSPPGGSGYTYSPPGSNGYTYSPGGSGYTYSPPGGNGYTYSPGGSEYSYPPVTYSPDMYKVPVSQLLVDELLLLADVAADSTFIGFGSNPDWPDGLALFFEGSTSPPIHPQLTAAGLTSSYNMTWEKGVGVPRSQGSVRFGRGWDGWWSWRPGVATSSRSASVLQTTSYDSGYYSSSYYATSEEFDSLDSFDYGSFMQPDNFTYGNATTSSDYIFDDYDYSNALGDLDLVGDNNRTGLFDKNLPRVTQFDGTNNPTVATADKVGSSPPMPVFGFIGSRQAGLEVLLVLEGQLNITSTDLRECNRPRKCRRGGDVVRVVPESRGCDLNPVNYRPGTTDLRLGLYSNVSLADAVSNTPVEAFFNSPRGQDWNQALMRSSPGKFKNVIPAVANFTDRAMASAGVILPHMPKSMEYKLCYREAASSYWAMRSIKLEAGPDLAIRPRPGSQLLLSGEHKEFFLRKEGGFAADAGGLQLTAKLVPWMDDSRLPLTNKICQVSPPGSTEADIGSAFTRKFEIVHDSETNVTDTVRFHITVPHRLGAHVLCVQFITPGPGSQDKGWWWRPGDIQKPTFNVIDNGVRWFVTAGNSPTNLGASEVSLLRCRTTPSGRCFFEFNEDVFDTNPGGDAAKIVRLQDNCEEGDHISVRDETIEEGPAVDGVTDLGPADGPSDIAQFRVSLPAAPNDMRMPYKVCVQTLVLGRGFPQYSRWLEVRHTEDYLEDMVEVINTRLEAPGFYTLKANVKSWNLETSARPYYLEPNVGGEVSLPYIRNKNVSEANVAMGGVSTTSLTFRFNYFNADPAARSRNYFKLVPKAEVIYPEMRLQRLDTDCTDPGLFGTTNVDCFEPGCPSTMDDDLGFYAMFDVPQEEGAYHVCYRNGEDGAWLTVPSENGGYSLFVVESLLEFALSGSSVNVFDLRTEEMAGIPISAATWCSDAVNCAIAELDAVTVVNASQACPAYDAQSTLPQWYQLTVISEGIARPAAGFMLPPEVMSPSGQYKVCVRKASQSPYNALQTAGFRGWAPAPGVYHLFNRGSYRTGGGSGFFMDSSVEPIVRLHVSVDRMQMNRFVQWDDAFRADYEFVDAANVTNPQTGYMSRSVAINAGSLVDFRVEVVDEEGRSVPFMSYAVSVQICTPATSFNDLVCVMTLPIEDKAQPIIHNVAGDCMDDEKLFDFGKNGLTQFTMEGQVEFLLQYASVCNMGSNEFGCGIKFVAKKLDADESDPNTFLESKPQWINVKSGMPTSASIDGRIPEGSFANVNDTTTSRDSCRTAQPGVVVPCYRKTCESGVKCSVKLQALTQGAPQFAPKGAVRSVEHYPAAMKKSPVAVDLAWELGGSIKMTEMYDLPDDVDTATVEVALYYTNGTANVGRLWTVFLVDVVRRQPVTATVQHVMPLDVLLRLSGPMAERTGQMRPPVSSPDVEGPEGPSGIAIARGLLEAMMPYEVFFAAFDAEGRMLSKTRGTYSAWKMTAAVVNSASIVTPLAMMGIDRPFPDPEHTGMLGDVRLAGPEVEYLAHISFRVVLYDNACSRFSNMGGCMIVFKAEKPGRTPVSAELITPVRLPANALHVVELPSDAPLELAGTAAWAPAYALMPGTSIAGMWVYDDFNLGDVFALIDGKWDGMRVRNDEGVMLKHMFMEEECAFETPEGCGATARPLEDIMIDGAMARAAILRLYVSKPCIDCQVTFHNTWGGAGEATFMKMEPSYELHCEAADVVVYRDDLGSMFTAGSLEVEVVAVGAAGGEGYNPPTWGKWIVMSDLRIDHINADARYLKSVDTSGSDVIRSVDGAAFLAEGLPGEPMLYRRTDEMARVRVPIELNDAFIEGLTRSDAADIASDEVLVRLHVRRGSADMDAMASMEPLMCEVPVMIRHLTREPAAMPPALSVDGATQHCVMDSPLAYGCHYSIQESDLASLGELVFKLDAPVGTTLSVSVNNGLASGPTTLTPRGRPSAPAGFTYGGGFVMNVTTSDVPAAVFTVTDTVEPVPLVDITICTMMETEPNSGNFVTDMCQTTALSVLPDNYRDPTAVQIAVVDFGAPIIDGVVSFEVGDGDKCGGVPVNMQLVPYIARANDVKLIVTWSSLVHVEVASASGIHTPTNPEDAYKQSYLTKSYMEASFPSDVRLSFYGAFPMPPEALAISYMVDGAEVAGQAQTEALVEFVYPGGAVAPGARFVGKDAVMYKDCRGGMFEAPAADLSVGYMQHSADAGFGWNYTHGVSVGLPFPLQVAVLDAMDMRVMNFGTSLLSVRKQRAGGCNDGGRLMTGQLHGRGGLVEGFVDMHRGVATIWSIFSAPCEACTISIDLCYSDARDRVVDGEDFEAACLASAGVDGTSSDKSVPLVRRTLQTKPFRVEPVEANAMVISEQMLPVNEEPCGMADPAASTSMPDMQGCAGGGHPHVTTMFEPFRIRVEPVKIFADRWMFPLRDDLSVPVVPQKFSVHVMTLFVGTDVGKYANGGFVSGHSEMATDKNMMFVDAKEGHLFETDAIGFSFARPCVECTVVLVWKIHNRHGGEAGVIQLRETRVLDMPHGFAPPPLRFMVHTPIGAMTDAVAGSPLSFTLKRKQFSLTVVKVDSFGYPTTRPLQTSRLETTFVRDASSGNGAGGKLHVTSPSVMRGRADSDDVRGQSYMVEMNMHGSATVRFAFSRACYQCAVKIGTAKHVLTVLSTPAAVIALPHREHLTFQARAMPAVWKFDVWAVDDRGDRAFMGKVDTMGTFSGTWHDRIAASLINSDLPLSVDYFGEGQGKVSLREPGSWYVGVPWSKSQPPGEVTVVSEGPLGIGSLMFNQMYTMQAGQIIPPVIGNLLRATEVNTTWELGPSGAHGVIEVYGVGYFKPGLSVRAYPGRYGDVIVTQVTCQEQCRNTSFDKSASLDGTNAVGLDGAGYVAEGFESCSCNVTIDFEDDDFDTVMQTALFTAVYVPEDPVSPMPSPTPEPADILEWRWLSDTISGSYMHAVVGVPTSLTVGVFSELTGSPITIPIPVNEQFELPMLHECFACGTDVATATLCTVVAKDNLLVVDGFFYANGTCTFDPQPVLDSATAVLGEAAGLLPMTAPTLTVDVQQVASVHLVAGTKPVGKTLEGKEAYAVHVPVEWTFVVVDVLDRPVAGDMSSALEVTFARGAEQRKELFRANEGHISVKLDVDEPTRTPECEDMFDTDGEIDVTGTFACPHEPVMVSYTWKMNAVSGFEPGLLYEGTEEAYFIRVATKYPVWARLERDCEEYGNETCVTPDGDSNPRMAELRNEGWRIISRGWDEPDHQGREAFTGIHPARWIYKKPLPDIMMVALDDKHMPVTHPEDQGSHEMLYFEAVGIPCINVDRALYDGADMPPACSIAASSGWRIASEVRGTAPLEMMAGELHIHEGDLAYRGPLSGSVMFTIGSLDGEGKLCDIDLQRPVALRPLMAEAASCKQNGPDSQCELNELVEPFTDLEFEIGMVDEFGNLVTADWESNVTLSAECTTGELGAVMTYTDEDDRTEFVATPTFFAEGGKFIAYNVQFTNKCKRMTVTSVARGPHSKGLKLTMSFTVGFLDEARTLAPVEQAVVAFSCFSMGADAALFNDAYSWKDSFQDSLAKVVARTSDSMAQALKEIMLKFVCQVPKGQCMSDEDKLSNACRDMTVTPVLNETATVTLTNVTNNVTSTGDNVTANRRASTLQSSDVQTEFDVVLFVPIAAAASSIKGAIVADLNSSSSILKTSSSIFDQADATAMEGTEDFTPAPPTPEPPTPTPETDIPPPPPPVITRPTPVPQTGIPSIVVPSNFTMPPNFFAAGASSVPSVVVMLVSLVAALATLL